MANKYFVWKDPNCNGENIEWVEMEGRAFTHFMRLPENKHRHFIRLGNQVCIEADVITIEATELEYKRWRKEYDASKPSNNSRKDVLVLSLDAVIPGSDGLVLADMIPAKGNIEKKIIHQDQLNRLKEALQSLDANELFIIHRLFVDQVSIRKLAHEINLAHKTLDYRYRKILKKLQEFLAQN